MSDIQCALQHLCPFINVHVPGIRVSINLRTAHTNLGRGFTQGSGIVRSASFGLREVRMNGRVEPQAPALELPTIPPSTPLDRSSLLPCALLLHVTVPVVHAKLLSFRRQIHGPDLALLNRTRSPTIEICEPMYPMVCFDLLVLNLFLEVPQGRSNICFNTTTLSLHI